MQKLLKIGRFAFIIPYLVMPFCVMAAYHVDLEEAMRFAYLMPFGLETWCAVLYPIGWLITIVCLILCHRTAKKDGDTAALKVNTVITVIAVWVAVVFLVAAGIFMMHFSMEL